MPPRPGVSRAGSSIAVANKTIVLVTGGNQGIGFEIVKSLALNNPNYQVLMGCRDTRNGEQAVASLGMPTNVNPIQLDITHDDSIDHCFRTIEQLFGKLDVLINNAGTAGNDMIQSFDEGRSRRDVWTKVYEVNCVSTGLLTERLLPLLQLSKDPRIVFVSSELGSIGNVKKYERVKTPHYSSSKSAVNMLAAYYALQNPTMRVNSVCPGLRATNFHIQGNTLSGEDKDPALGAVRVVELVTGNGRETGTYSNAEGPLPW